MKIAIVGGAGFIGSHVVDALIEDDHKVIVVDNLFLGKKENVNPKADFFEIDATEFLLLKCLFDEFKPDVVYNLAVLPLPHSLECPCDNVMKNVQITTNLLELQLRNWFGRLIHFSSSEVYGSAIYTPMCENHPLESSTPYAASKAACDLICLSYQRTFGNRVAIIRPFNNYGPRQNDKSYAGIIPLTINRMKNGQMIVVYGDGKQTRDYIYVKDTAKAALMLLYRPDLDGEIINIASGRDISVETLINEIVIAWRQVTGSDAMFPVQMSPERPGDVRRHIANVLKAKDVLGFETTVCINEGLKETIKFYLNK